MAVDQRLRAFLKAWADGRPERGPTAAAMLALSRSAAEIAGLVEGAAAGTLNRTVGGNAGGDSQKLLDLRANEIILTALEDAPVSAVTSEELDDIRILDRSGKVAVAIDPLDGSSNIDANVSIGTIFSILPARSEADPDFSAFFAPGRMQLAAGFAIYGPQTILVFSLGAGTHVAQFDPGLCDFVVAEKAIRLPAGKREYAVNTSNYRFWEPAVRAYVDDCVAGKDGPRGADYNMRWIASLVAEAYRILSRGGVFLYPRDSRKGYGQGRLRLIYEANPIAFLVEQAGGAATDGMRPILDLIPRELHQRTPLVFGARDEVERVAIYYRGLSEPIYVAPLFNQRSLYRN
ncbi:class 1 fructose-bisphosphatase [Dongia deserti]|uniref:class 1 fructose-bisphosphatase n=1 Tax=Dongia deserti TaxID=2268030 RepID=UPI000E64B667|nr:class 1 fructose-bisphosphatase [Dongia deserti]